MDELLAWQLQFHEGERFACKSLCNVASDAQELGLFQFQLELTEQAISIYQRDSWAWCQLGKARLNCGKLEKAQTAYEQAIRMAPGEVVAKTGLAEVLKAMGRYPEALAAYEQAAQTHPEDVVAKNGLAEVLKAMGRYREARDAYLVVRAQHPENRVAVNGLAAVLVELGCLDEALALVSHDEHTTLDDWIDEHSRGMILVYQGQRFEAAKLFQRGLDECPFPKQKVYFRGAIVATQMRLNQLAEASRIVDEIDAPELAEPVRSLRIQLCGLQENFEEAGAHFRQRPVPASIVGRELFGELERRFVQRLSTQRDDDWLLRQQLRFQTECFRHAA